MPISPDVMNPQVMLDSSVFRAVFKSEKDFHVMNSALVNPAIPGVLRKVWTLGVLAIFSLVMVEQSFGQDANSSNAMNDSVGATQRKDSLLSTLTESEYVRRRPKSTLKELDAKITEEISKNRRTNSALDIRPSQKIRVAERTPIYRNSRSRSMSRNLKTGSNGSSTSRHLNTKPVIDTALQDYPGAVSVLENRIALKPSSSITPRTQTPRTPLPRTTSQRTTSPRRQSAEVKNRPQSNVRTSRHTGNTARSQRSRKLPVVSNSNSKNRRQSTRPASSQGVVRLAQSPGANRAISEKHVNSSPSQEKSLPKPAKTVPKQVNTLPQPTVQRRNMNQPATSATNSSSSPRYAFKSESVEQVIPRTFPKLNLPKTTPAPKLTLPANRRIENLGSRPAVNPSLGTTSPRYVFAKSASLDAGRKIPAGKVSNSHQPATSFPRLVFSQFSDTGTQGQSTNNVAPPVPYESDRMRATENVKPPVNVQKLADPELIDESEFDEPAFEEKGEMVGTGIVPAREFQGANPVELDPQLPRGESLIEPVMQTNVAPAHTLGKNRESVQETNYAYERENSLIEQLLPRRSNYIGMGDASTNARPSAGISMNLSSTKPRLEYTDTDIERNNLEWSSPLRAQANFDVQGSREGVQRDVAGLRWNVQGEQSKFEGVQRNVEGVSVHFGDSTGWTNKAFRQDVSPLQVDDEKRSDDDLSIDDELELDDEDETDAENEIEQQRLRYRSDLSRPISFSPGQMIFGYVDDKGNQVPASEERRPYLLDFNGYRNNPFSYGGRRQNQFGCYWEPKFAVWKSPDLCYQPLYYEDMNLERYGARQPFLQPGLSAIHFFGSTIRLPYMMALDPIHECQYSAGFGRPGNKYCYQRERFVWSLKAGSFQTLLVAAAVFGLP